MSIDFRKCLYALSDVIINRPPPLRVYDQIYMKLPDMLLQAEVIGRWFNDKTVLFIGDGDAIGLAVAHLGNQELIPGLPNHIHVLDFDERIILSIKNFAKEHDLNNKISARLYNVADPLPEDIWQSYDAFYTNPPWGSVNGGSSVWAFVGRGIEGVKSDATGCIIIGDHPSFCWTHEVLASTQEKALKEGFHVAELIPEFHRYHLDDNPELTSCCLILRRTGKHERKYNSQRLGQNDLKNFYGREAPLQARYIRDLTDGGRFPSRDFKVEPLEKE